MVKKIVLILLTLFTKISAEQKVIAHIFIHGTRCSLLSLVSAIPMAKQALRDDHLYSRVVATSRNDLRFQESQVMLDRGMIEITHGMIDRCRNLNLDSTFSKKAAIHAVNGYDYLNSDKLNIHHYYTYGWDGMLSDHYRKNDSLAMYKALISLRDKLSKEYPNKKISFILHGHSHGGNLILYLPFHENNLKQNLVIDYTLLYGTPIQIETASYCLHPLFKTIINIYSEGDHIQIADKISTASRTSGRRLHDIVSIQNRPIIDVCISAAYDRKAFSHASYFFIGEYQKGVSKARRHIFNDLKYVPIVTLAPLFIELIEKTYTATKEPQLNLNFSKENNQCILCAETIDKRYASKSKNLIPLINPINNIIEKVWKPAASYKGPVNVAKLAMLNLMEATAHSVSKN